MPGGEWLDEDAWPPLRAFKVENTEDFVEEGRPRPKKQRDLWIPGLGIRPVDFTGNGWPAVSASVLARLGGDPPESPGAAYEHFGGGEEGERACDAINALHNVGAVDTMLSNFILPLQAMADSHGRVHCSLNLNTETGRLSARRPNLQNQPALEKVSRVPVHVRGATAVVQDRYEIRRAFCASPGNQLIIADYGQLELRILAHMARCKSMIEAFASGGDFHSRTAVGMYDHIKEAIASGQCLLEWDDASGPRPAPLLKNLFASERRKAKVLNFSIAYGKTALGLSQDWNVSVEEAQQTLERWYADRPEVRAWQEQVLSIARRTGATRTLMGRYRDLPEINSANRKLRGHAQRAAINTPIQGGAADVVMMAMLKIARNARLKQLGYTLILQIHDEVILEGPEEHAEEAKALVEADMARPFEVPLLVDLVVDASIASNWYDGK
jgi:DNA polymerase I